MKLYDRIKSFPTIYNYKYNRSLHNLLASKIQEDKKCKTIWEKKLLKNILIRLEFTLKTFFIVDNLVRF